MLLAALSSAIRSEWLAASVMALLLLLAALGLRSRLWPARALLGSLLLEEWFALRLLAPIPSPVPAALSFTALAVALLLCLGVRLPDWAFALRGKWLRRLLSGLVLAGIMPHGLMMGLLGGCLDPRNSWWLTQALLLALFALLLRPAWDVLTRGWSGRAMEPPRTCPVAVPESSLR